MLRLLAAVRRPAVAMHRFMVRVAVMMNVVMPMHCRVMPTPCYAVRVADERSACAVLKPLPVAQAAAPSLSLAGGVRGAMARMAGVVVGVVRTGIGMGTSTTTDVDPAVRRPRSRHGRKRRWCLRSGLQVRRWSRCNFGRGLLRRRKRLVARGLLRG
jgi:hypothetical protein